MDITRTTDPSISYQYSILKDLTHVNGIRLVTPPPEEPGTESSGTENSTTSQETDTSTNTTITPDPNATGWGVAEYAIVGGSVATVAGIGILVNRKRKTPSPP